MYTESLVDITEEEAIALVQQLRRHYRNLFVPDPKIGGTYYYCRSLVEVEKPKFDRNGRKTRYTVVVHEPCNHRVRKLQTYRRHWRRKHMTAA